MCRPTSFARRQSAKYDKVNPTSSSNGISKVWLISAVFALFVAISPALISEQIGGWTAKYTSPVKFSAPDSIQDLSGKVVIVTGANTGIGYHTALELARANAHVIVGARSKEKGQAAVERMKQEILEDEFKNAASRHTSQDSSPTIQFLPLDLSSLHSVKEFAESFQALQLPLHILVNNAGIMKSPGAQFVGQNLTYGFDLTKDGFEAHIGVNHIGHFYLTQLLRDNLVESSPSRVVAVSSMSEEGAYQPEGLRFDAWKPQTREHAIEMGYEDGLAYGQSKLANLLFARELASQLGEKGVSAYSCHPGVIASELVRYMIDNAEEQMKHQSWWQIALQRILGKYFEFAQMKTADGALTQLHLATADVTTLQNGAFYHPIGRMMGGGKHSQGENETLQKQMWTVTEQLITEVMG